MNATRVQQTPYVEAHNMAPGDPAISAAFPNPCQPNNFLLYVICFASDVAGIKAHVDLAFTNAGNVNFDLDNEDVAFTNGGFGNYLVAAIQPCIAGANTVSFSVVDGVNNVTSVGIIGIEYTNNTPNTGLNDSQFTQPPASPSTITTQTDDAGNLVVAVLWNDVTRDGSLAPDSLSGITLYNGLSNGQLIGDASSDTPSLNTTAAFTIPTANIASVGTPQLTANFVGTDTQTEAYTSAGAGNAIVVGIMSVGNTIVSVVDNMGQTYAHLVTYSDPGGGGVQEIYGVLNTVAGVTSITVTYSAVVGSRIPFGVSEYSGVSGFGNTNGGSVAGAAYSLANVLTSGGNYNVLFGYTGDPTGVDATATLGTIRASLNAAFSSAFIEDNTAVTPGSLAVAGTLSASVVSGPMAVVELVAGTGNAPALFTVSYSRWANPSATANRPSIVGLQNGVDGKCLQGGNKILTRLVNFSELTFEPSPTNVNNIRAFCSFDFSSDQNIGPFESLIISFINVDGGVPYILIVDDGSGVPTPFGSNEYVTLQSSWYEVRQFLSPSRTVNVEVITSSNVSDFSGAQMLIGVANFKVKPHNIQSAFFIED